MIPTVIGSILIPPCFTRIRGDDSLNDGTFRIGERFYPHTRDDPVARAILCLRALCFTRTRGGDPMPTLANYSWWNSYPYGRG